MLSYEIINLNVCLQTLEETCLLRFRLSRFRLATRDLNGPRVEVSVLAVQTQQPATDGVVGVLSVVEYINHLRLKVHNHEEQLKQSKILSK